MDRLPDTARCSVAKAAAIVGDRWTVVVLRDLFYGVRRFDDLADHLGIARNVLTRRLAALVEAGIVDKVPYREPGSRERHEYRLTRAGYDLRPILLALMAWGDAYQAGPEGPPVQVEHVDCGAPVHLEVRCEAGHTVPPQELRSVFTPSR